MPITGYTKWEEELGITPGETAAKRETLAKQLDEDIPDETSFVEEASFKREQVIGAAEAELNMLAGLAIPTVFSFLFPRVLLAAWQLLTTAVQKTTRDFTRIALGIPRGHGKTTLIKLFVLFCVLFTKRKFILIISDIGDKAENILADVVDMLNESNIIRLFGDWKLGMEKDTQAVKKFGFRGRSIIIAALGAGGSLRGLNLKNARPDVMIFDDIQSAEVADSKIQSEALERWMLGTAMKAKSPTGCLYIFAGNMFPTQYSILKKLKTNPSWIKFISGAILADGTALWHDLHPLQELLDELDHDIAAGHPEIFFAEVLNDTEAGINSKVDLSRLLIWPWAEHELPQGKFIVIDPSANKLGGDDVAIGYFEVFDGKPALKEVIEENLSPGNMIRRALLMALNHGCSTIAIEANAYQATALYWFDQVCKSIGLEGIHLVEVFSGSYSKNARITDTLKSLTAGEIALHPAVKSAVSNQIANWNPLRRNNQDNVLDLLSYAPKVIELYAHLITQDNTLVYSDYENAKVLPTTESSCF